MKRRIICVCLLLLLVGCGTTNKTPIETTVDPETGQDQFLTDPIPEGKPVPVEPQNAEVTDTAYTCTISISCATILDNMDLCADEKTELVPADGWILQPMDVTFHEGESVFDVLLRICQETRRQ